jgi:hypothetical protein
MKKFSHITLMLTALSLSVVPVSASDQEEEKITKLLAPFKENMEKHNLTIKNFIEKKIMSQELATKINKYGLTSDKLQPIGDLTIEFLQEQRFGNLIKNIFPQTQPMQTQLTSPVRVSQESPEELLNKQLGARLSQLGIDPSKLNKDVWESKIKKTEQGLTDRMQRIGKTFELTMTLKEVEEAEKLYYGNLEKRAEQLEITQQIKTLRKEAWLKTIQEEEKKLVERMKKIDRIFEPTMTLGDVKKEEDVYYEPFQKRAKELELKLTGENYLWKKQVAEGESNLKDRLEKTDKSWVPGTTTLKDVVTAENDPEYIKKKNKEKALYFKVRSLQELNTNTEVKRTDKEIKSDAETQISQMNDDQIAQWVKAEEERNMKKVMDLNKF